LWQKFKVVSLMFLGDMPSANIAPPPFLAAWQALECERNPRPNLTSCKNKVLAKLLTRAWDENPNLRPHAREMEVELQFLDDAFVRNMQKMKVDGHECGSEGGWTRSSCPTIFRGSDASSAPPTPTKDDSCVCEHQVTITSAQLINAVCQGDTATLSTLLSIPGAQSLVNHQEEDNGSTLLHIAAQRGHAAVTDQLIAARCNVDCQAKYGATPLFIAAYHGHAAVTTQLIVARCNVDLQTQTAATPLRIATQQGHASVTEQLIAAGSNVNFQQPKDGATPLHIAAHQGHAVIAKQLLAARCDINLQDTGGNTALEVAEFQGQHIVAKLLEEEEEKEKAAGAASQKKKQAKKEQEDTETRAARRLLYLLYLLALLVQKYKY
jgi:ankyrin repeat protein